MTQHDKRLPGPRPGPAPSPRPGPVSPGPAPARPAPSATPVEPDDASRPGGAAKPPRTGHPVIDAALADLVGLAERPLDEHQARLAAAHETVNAALSGQHPLASQPPPAGEREPERR